MQADAQLQWDGSKPSENLRFFEESGQMMILGMDCNGKGLKDVRCFSQERPKTGFALRSY